MQTTQPPEEKKSRRDFLLWLGTILNVVAGVLVGVPLVGYVFSNFLRPTPGEWIPIGDLNDFPEGTTRRAVYRNPYHRPWDGQTAEIPCWIRRLEGEKFQVFAVNCTHLGCPVRWFSESELFMCPCHGGVFYADGARAAGPPPRSMYEYEYKIEGGKLVVKAGNLPTLANRIAT
jgi:Rieske Fe-S protein